MRSTTLLVAAADTGAVAFWHGGPSQDLPHTQEVFGFYAHPEHWGTGVAATLMQHGVERLAQSGDGKAVLWTLADAGRARRFYENAGRQLMAGQRTRDFGDGRELALVQYQRSFALGLSRQNRKAIRLRRTRETVGPTPDRAGRRSA